MSYLIPLFDGSQNGQATKIIKRVSLSIIILPELGAHTPTRTTNTLAQIQPSSRIFEFFCKLSLDDGMIWASLIQKANELLDVILQQPQLWSYPLVLVCHGLSGIIAKRTLGILDERYYEENVKLLLDAQSGIVFISTPHLTYSRQDYWQRVNSVLRSCPGYSKWQSQNEIATIANVCAKFENAQVENPILSVYETKETKVGEGWRTKKLLVRTYLLSVDLADLYYLVGPELAQIGARDEDLVSIEADHHEIINVDADSDLCKHLSAFFNKVQSQRHTHYAQSLRRIVTGVQRLPVARDDDDKDTWASSEYKPAEGGNASGQIEEGQTADLIHVSNLATRGTTDVGPQESSVITSADFLKLRRVVNLPCYFLHSYVRNPDFSGRDDVMAQMDKILLPTGHQRRQTANGPQSFVLSGLGGVGKTQCALEYAFSRQDRFDAILWAHADTTPKLDESFSQISVALKLEHPAKAGDRVVSRNLVMEWLSNPVKGPQASMSEIDPAAQRASWLLIFDNADDPSVLADYWPSSGTGVIVLTSRDPLARKYFSSSGMDLEPLTAESAAALLRKLSEVVDTDDEIESSIKVAKRMGGLPLAISLAAAAILRQELTFEEFLAFYEVEPKAADVRPISLKPENQYQYTLSTVWELDALEKPAECLLRLLSVLDPDNVDERIITQKLASGLPSDYPDTKAAFIKARTSLLKSSLVKRDKSSSQLSIHRLTQDFVRLKMSSAVLQDHFGTAVRFCMQYWPIPVVAVSYSTTTWPASQAVASHVLFLRELWMKQPALADDPNVKQQLADLTWRVAWYFTERGSSAEDVEGILLTSLQICESEPLLRLTDTYSQALFALSAIYGFENNPIPGLKYAISNLYVARAMDKDPKLSQFLGLAYNQVGWALLVNDGWEDAAKAFRDSIEVYSEWIEVTQRGFRPEFPWGGLAIALSEMGSHEEAAQIFMDTIRHREKLFGPADTDSVKLGWAMQGLGGVRLRQGRLDESFEAYQKALANFKITSGPRYFRTGQALAKLGEHYTLRREFSEADSHFQQALMIYQDRIAYKGEYARILHLQAKMHEAMEGSEATINDLQSRALKLYKEVVESQRLSVYGASLDDVDFNKVVAMWAR